MLMSDLGKAPKDGGWLPGEPAMQMVGILFYLILFSLVVDIQYYISFVHHSDQTFLGIFY